jgi:hypothetical protein
MFSFLKRKPKTNGAVHVGKAQVALTAPAHVRGVKQGNARGNFNKGKGLQPTADGARATAFRSTGINPEGHLPIDPKMPRLPPA